MGWAEEMTEYTYRPVFVCSNCNGIIYEEDIYYTLNGEIWCEDCINENKRIAELENYDDYF